MIDNTIREAVKEIEQKHSPLLSLEKIRDTGFYRKAFKSISANLLEKVKGSLENAKITLQTLSMNDQTNVSKDCAFLIGQINSFMLCYEQLILESETKIAEGNEKLTTMISDIVEQVGASLPKQQRIKISDMVMEKQVTPIFNLEFFKEKDTSLYFSIDAVLKELLKREDKFKEVVQAEVERSS